MIEVKCKLKYNNMEMPKYQTDGAAGIDLRAYSYDYLNGIKCDTELEEDSHLMLAPQERILIKTGIFIELPKGYEFQVRPRSGLALKYGITVLNTPGTVDWDYRGEVGVILFNTSNDYFVINKGDRIAQGVFNKIEQARFIQSYELSVTQRGDKGYNSTGNK